MIQPVSRQHPIANSGDDIANRPTIRFPQTRGDFAGWGPRLKV